MGGTEENWDHEGKSDTELELNRDRISKYATKRKKRTRSKNPE